MAEVQTYLCPDGIHRSLYPDRHDCPAYSQQTGLGALPGGTRSRFLGAKGRRVVVAEALELEPTPEPEPLNTKRLVVIGAAGFALVLLLLFLARRRKGK